MKTLKRGVIYVIAFVCAMTLFSFAGYSAYIYQNKAKRVIATKNSEGNPFSSNIMLEYDKSFAENYTAFSLYSYSYLEGNSTQDVTITVCNFPQAEPNMVNDHPINYTLSVSVYDTEGKPEEDSEQYSLFSIKKNGGDNQKFTSQEMTLSENSLQAKTKNQDTYVITCPIFETEEENKYYIVVSAIPTNETFSYVSGKILGRRITFSQSEPPTASWTGKVEQFPENENIYGFNYILKGTGKGTITLSWDSNMVAFGSENDLNNENLSEGKLEFEVDGAVQNYYSLQFYRINASTENDCNFQCSFIEKDEVEEND